MTFKQVKKIPLTQGKFALVAEEDYEYLSQWKWYYAKGYAVRNSPGPRQRQIFMHRVILERMGFKDFEDGDHRSRRKLDNRQRNLRVATRSQNCCNKRKQCNNTSGYIGVSWHKRDKKWQAYIKLEGKQRSLGYHKDKKEAALAYNEAAKKYHGEFAVLNEVH